MIKRCVIMQPTYLPWAGYFNLIARSDCFVFLDDVQFEKQSWQNRNRILQKDTIHWLTVPVKRVHLSDLIHEIRIDEQKDWRRKHIELLRHSYGKHPHGKMAIDLVEGVLIGSSGLLSQLNREFILATCELLGLKRKFFLSSELGVDGARSERLSSICNALGCDTYLSPVGATEYLRQDGVFHESIINLEFQDFESTPYTQSGHKGFVSHLSIVDVLANAGVKQTYDYVHSNFDRLSD